ncbi:MAG: prolyl oligopeptidase family serine peptidase [Acidiferrobacterales bacterium]|nr:prolyl oligopeptidase family serine peptidase [Acidiferrobacterales bacterium]
MTDYLNWQSKLSLEQVFFQGEAFNHPTPLREGFIYLSSIKEEDNRAVLKFKNSFNTNNDAVCITPSPFSCRTKINEYGGKPYWLFNNEVYFANQSDQRLYCQTIDIKQGIASAPKPVSPEPIANDTYMYADLVNYRNRWMLTVVETSIDDDPSENIHSIQTIKLNEEKPQMLEIESGADFYSNLVISNDAKKIAWVQWNHPNMPWDDTQLWVADIIESEDKLVLRDKERIDFTTSDTQQASICQLVFANDGKLFFSIDFQEVNSDSSKNYWNIMCYQFDKTPAQIVTNHHLEFGYPHWQFGDTRIVQFDDRNLLTFGTGADGDVLFLIDQETLQVAEIIDSAKENKLIQNLASNRNGIAMAVISSLDSNPCLVSLNQNGQAKLQARTLISNINVLSNEDISVAQHVEFETSDKARAYGYFYPPVNSSFNNHSAPPLIVMVHGGPTARAYGYFDIQKQFWTNRGFAIFDVNPRGSTGYGRNYRDALYGQWGVQDIADVIDGINYLISAEKVAADKICIRGKSSGGYAVLCALTDYPDMFQAGACYYGIGNLVTLAEVTHKFEKHYTDRLIDERYDREFANHPQSKFFQRSPINRISKLKTSMIIFQGLDDKIVPPSVAQELVSVLENAEVAYTYAEYPEEGHGFRQVSNNIDALSRELEFYRKVLSGC